MVAEKICGEWMEKFPLAECSHGLLRNFAEREWVLLLCAIH